MDFELVRPLGRGEFGSVDLYRHRLGVCYGWESSRQRIALSWKSKENLKEHSHI